MQEEQPDECVLWEPFISSLFFEILWRKPREYSVLYGWFDSLTPLWDTYSINDICTYVDWNVQSDLKSLKDNLLQCFYESPKVSSNVQSTITILYKKQCIFSFINGLFHLAAKYLWEEIQKGTKEKKRGCLWHESFGKHHKGRDVSRHFTRRNFRNGNPPSWRTRRKKTRDGAKSGESSWEEGKGWMCLYASLLLGYYLWVCLRLCHPVQKLSWERGCQRNRHISITFPLFLVLFMM